MSVEESNRSSSQFPRLADRNRFVLHGIAASLVLTFAYFAIVSLSESFDHAIAQFIGLSYLMIPLIIGFGVQVSLFSYSKQLSKAMRQGSISVTTSGGVSAASMITCCAHHVTDAFAFIGLTAVTLFLADYQAPFILIGVSSNIVGILTILASIQRTRLYDPRSFFGKLMSSNLKRIRNYVLVLSTIIIISSFVWIALVSRPVPADNARVFFLPTKTAVQNGLTIQVTPSPFKYGDEVKFSLGLDTHSGDLNFDLTKVAILEDGNGTKYTPIGWSGSAAGGHHREGTLTFAPFQNKPSSMKLILPSVYDADWGFEWELA